MRVALSETVVDGIKTTIQFTRLFGDRSFLQGNYISSSWTRCSLDGSYSGVTSEEIAAVFLAMKRTGPMIDLARSDNRRTRSLAISIENQA